MENYKDNALYQECCQTGHVLCNVDLPMNSCAITAMPKGLFTNCQWMAFFGLERYNLGWYNVEEIAQFLLFHGFHLAVKRDDETAIQYITHPEATNGLRPSTKGILIKNTFNLHWYGGEFFNTKITFSDVAFIIYKRIHEITLAKKVFSQFKLNKNKNKSKEEINPLLAAMISSGAINEINKPLNLADFYQYDDSDEEDSDEITESDKSVNLAPKNNTNSLITVIFVYLFIIKLKFKANQRKLLLEKNKKSMNFLNNRISTIIFSDSKDEDIFWQMDSKHPFKLHSDINDKTGVSQIKYLLQREGVKLTSQDLEKASHNLIDLDQVTSIEKLSKFLSNLTTKFYLCVFIALDQGNLSCVKFHKAPNPLFLILYQNDWFPLVRCCFNNSGLRLKNLDIHGKSIFKKIEDSSPISTDLIDKISVSQLLIQDIKNCHPTDVIQKYVYNDNNINPEDSILIDTYLARLFPEQYISLRRQNTKIIESKNKETQSVPNKNDWKKRLADVFKKENEDFFDYENYSFQRKQKSEIIKDEDIEKKQENEIVDVSDVDSDDLEDDLNMDSIENNLIIEDEIKDCCWCYDNLTVANSHLFINYLDQFYDCFPANDCLQLALQNIEKLFSMYHKSGLYTIKTNLTLKKCVKFRHDCFAYAVINSIEPEGCKFGTDADLSFLGTNKTPDYVKIENKSMKIYEFTVVNNLLRGNLLKGIDRNTSKYKKEILLAEQQGFNVAYYPVLFSTSSNLKENLEYLQTKNHKISETFHGVLQGIIDCIPPDYRYLIQLTFKKQESLFGANQNRNEKGWCYEYKNLNLRRFLTFKLKSKNLEDTFNYNIYFTNETYFVSSDKGFYTGLYLKNLASDESSLLTVFKKEMNGKKLFLIKSIRNNIENVQTLTSHSTKEINSDENLELLNNYLKHDIYNVDAFNQISEKLFNMKEGDLVKKFSIEKIKIEIEAYSKRLNNWSKVKNSTPAVLDSPRRSFYNLLDSSKCSDRSYEQGIELNYSGNTLSIKTILNNLDKVSFKKRILYVEKPNDYKQSLNDFYDWLSNLIKKPYKMSFKNCRALLLNEDKLKFDEKVSNLKKLQTDYIKSIKGINSGVLNIGDDIKEMIAEECNWKGGGLYKLYMGEPKDLNELKKVMYSLCSTMKFNFTIPDSSDIGFISQLKEIENNKLNYYINEIQQTNLFQCLLFHSRLCYTLMAISNRNESHRYVVLDNLGLSNVALIVKGGKKMLNTRKSKIFKLITPILADCLDYNPNNTHNGNHFQNETSWMQLNQTALLDGLALPYKFLCNYISLRDKYDEFDCKEILFLPTMLALHNRRKTEINLHNMRYFMVNAIGEFSQVEELLKEFDTPCYTAFEKAIYTGFKDNYIKYVESVVKWSELRNNSNEAFEAIPVQHPILDRKLLNINDFTYCIYGTYMMSKNVDNQSLEQTLNLEKIIDTHEYFINNPPLDLDQNLDLYKSDFSYSKKCAYEVGKVLAAEIRKNYGVRTLQVKYDQIMNTNIDSIANNRGLRYQGNDFFGHKGYYVVYKQLLEEGFTDILDIINSDDTLLQKYVKIKSLNQVFANKQLEQPLNQAVMHVVDKVQRGGPREIYVMDYTTKLHQSTIEKMFKCICELVDNELITVPSSKRANAIHKKNFEYKSDKYVKYYLTFDCRKWAPRSNFSKYVDMLQGMKEVLPFEFIEHVENFFNQYKQKQIHTRKEIYDQLIKKNPNYSKHFTLDEEKKSAYFVMPYSFVMGIFNMLSSLYHAGVQLLADRETCINNFEKYNIITALLLDAHSDDSQGTLNIEKNNNIKIDEVAKNTLSYYQHLQKANNHLMSIKKCNISQNYLEFLSVLYLNSELLPLLPKFLGNFSANFSGKGISQDFRSVISKSIELQMNGESHASCYKIQIILSNFYRNFYRVKHDTTLPALGGFANSWPPFYIYFGSCVDEVRLSYTNPELFGRIMTFAHEYMEFDSHEGTFSLTHISNSKVPKAYRDIKKKIKLPEFEDNTWFFSQNKTRSAQLNVLWFRAMLDDKHFMISLLNINEVRRAVDSFYYASRDSIICKDQTYNINNLYNAILKTTPKDISYYNIYKNYFKSAIEFYEDLSLIENFSLEEKSRISFKPASISMNDMNEVPHPEGKSLSIAVNMCRKELIPYLFEDKLYDEEIIRFKEYMESNDIPIEMKTVKNFLDFCNKRREKTFFLYMRCPSNSRVLVGAEGMLNHLVNNYLEDKKIIINQNNFRLLKKEEIKVQSKIINYVNACYLYHIAKQTKDQDLMILKLNSNVDNQQLNTIHYKKPDLDKLYCDFVDYIGRFDGTSIDLTNFQGYALWIDKQYKVMGEWVGKGRLYVKLKHIAMIVYTNNNVIERILTDSNTDLIFSDSETCYLNYLFRHSNLKFEYNPRNLNGYHFGYNRNGNLGLHKGDFIRVGIPCFLNQNTNQYFNYNKCHIHYEYGKFIINLMNERYHLITFDYLCYNINKGRLFDILDWENLTVYQKNLFMNTACSGDFGDLDNLKYLSDELIKNFTKTELYNVFYKKYIKEKIDLLKFLWADVVNSSTTSDDFLPVMFENTSLFEINKLLPESKKENLKILQYFNVDNSLLFSFKANLSSMETDAQRSEYLLKVLADLGENAELTKLPEIGNPLFFKRVIEDKKMGLSSLNQMITDFAFALSEAFNELNTVDKQKLTKLSRINFNYDFILTTFYDLMSEKDFNIEDYASFTNHSFIVHDVLKSVFEDTTSLLKFSKSLRRTSLALAPRHPRYADEWQFMLANFYTKIVKFDALKKDIDLLGPFARKYLKNVPNLSKTKNENPLITPMLNLFYDIDLSELHLSPMDISVAGLNSFINTNNKVKYCMSLLEDVIDDYDIEFNYVRQKEKTKWTTITNAAPQNYAGAVAVQHFIPLKNVKSKYINNKKYYLYNVNDDIALQSGWKKDNCNKESRLLLRFERYYNESLPDFFMELKESKKIPYFVKPTSEYVKTYNLHDPSLYTENLFNEIVQNEKLEDEDAEELRNIYFAKRSPIIKSLMISKILNKRIQDMDFNNLVNEALKQFKSEGLKMDVEAEKMLMLDYRIAGKNKKQMIMKASGYKKEIMQFDEILGGNFSEALLKNTKLDKIRKITLINHINAVLQYYKLVKDKNKMAFFGFLKDFIRQIEVDSHCNREGLALEERLRVLINDNSTDVIEESDDELFSEPEFNDMQWNIKKLSRP
jgi:hypothetical protein